MGAPDYLTSTVDGAAACERVRARDCAGLDDDCDGFLDEYEDGDDRGDGWDDDMDDEGEISW